MACLISRALVAFLSIAMVMVTVMAMSLASLAGCASVPQLPALTGTGVVLAIVEAPQADATASMAGTIGGALVGGKAGRRVGG